MKTALISDIHGNFPALQAVISRIDRENCDLIVSLGDIAGYYCMINECIELCRDRGIVNILGNHDHYLTAGVECLRSTTVNACINFQRRVIKPENLAWLRASIPEYRSSCCWFVHGGWVNPLEEYVGDFDFSAAPDPETRIFASGHTHIQSLQRNAGIVYVNPGSVGQPRDGDPRAAFAIIEADGNISLYREQYDIEEIAIAMKTQGFEERLFKGLYNGTRIQPFTTANTK